MSLPERVLENPILRRGGPLAVGWVLFVADSCRISSEGHSMLMPLQHEEHQIIFQSNVGAEHCSALIDQRDRLRFSGLDAPEAKNDSVPAFYGLAELFATGNREQCRISSEGHNILFPYSTNTAFTKGFRKSRVGVFAQRNFRVLPLCASCGAITAYGFA